MSDVAAPAPRRFRKLTDLLDALSQAARGEQVSVGDVLDEIGHRSFTPIILAIAVLLVSPVSGIPGVPTISALLILMIGAQGLAGRQHLWLPGVLMRRRVSGAKFRNALDWLRKPCGWIDRHSHPRLRLLVHGPARALAFLLCVLIPLSWPMLEILPMVTSVGAGAVGLLAFGLLTHDGLYVLLGYCLTGASVALVLALI